MRPIERILSPLLSTHTYLMISLLISSCLSQSGCDSNCIACSSNICSSCKSGYGLSGTYTCVKCGTNCQSCSTWGLSEMVCDNCTRGYTQSTDDNNNCIKCPTGCSECFVSEICTSCQSGYYIKLETDFLCHVCPVGCSICAKNFTSPTNNTVCVECKAGYTIDGFNCKKKNFNYTITVAAVMIGVICLFFIIVSVCYCCFCRKDSISNNSSNMVVYPQNQGGDQSHLQLNNENPGFNGAGRGHQQGPQVMGNPAQMEMESPSQNQQNAWGDQNQSPISYVQNQRKRLTPNKANSPAPGPNGGQHQLPPGFMDTPMKPLAKP